MATISAWAVGSFVEVTRFQPRPTIRLSRTAPLAGGHFLAGEPDRFLEEGLVHGLDRGGRMDRPRRAASTGCRDNRKEKSALINKDLRRFSRASPKGQESAYFPMETAFSSLFPRIL
jgi:hypothetical protein